MNTYVPGLFQLHPAMDWHVVIEVTRDRKRRLFPNYYSNPALPWMRERERAEAS